MSKIRPGSPPQKISGLVTDKGQEAQSTGPASAPDESLGAGLSHTAATEGSEGPRLVATEMRSVGPKDAASRRVQASLSRLEPMDRKALRQKFHRPTTRMAHFLGENLQKRPTGEVIGGIPQFTVGPAPADDALLSFRDYGLEEVLNGSYFQNLSDYWKKPVLFDYDDGDGGVLPPVNNTRFEFTGRELKSWQDSARTYFDPARYETEELQVALRGQKVTPSQVDDPEGFRSAVDQAFKAKFLVKMAQAPIFCNTSGDPLPRLEVDQPLPEIWIGSQCGMDLDLRTHDRNDSLSYIVRKDGSPITEREVVELEFLRNVALSRGTEELTAEDAHALLRERLGGYQLNRELMLEHAVRMKRLYMEAQVDAGIEVPVVVAMGCGVFARWFADVPDVMAEADRQVLSDPQWKERGIEAVVYALPRFSMSGREPYDHYAEKFSAAPPGNLPVHFVDQDGITIARALAQKDFKVSLMNPADSDLSAGEYWENRGPALEEWLALTTGMLLTQHASINPKVTDPASFRPVPLPASSATASE